MKSYYFKGFIIGLFVSLFISCENALVVQDPSLVKPNSSRSRVSDDEATQLKKEFAVALAKALKESQALRSLIKNKALEKVDEDYDVLYHLIKNEKLENGQTVRDLISKYYKNKGQLQVIENKLRTLTIFVPDLPMGSFSAQSWNVEQQIPKVAVRLKSTNDVPIIGADEKEYVLESKYAPGFPVVVVKESIRFLDNSHEMFRKVNSKSKFRSNDGIEFRLLDDAFDRKLNVGKKRGGRLAVASAFDSRVVNAFNIFSGTDNWHRDHIYYNLTNSQDKGAFSYAYEETITSFRMNENNPMGCYNQISDQTGEPSYTPSPYEAQNTFWTGGSYNFRFKFLLNSRNGTGAETIKYVPIAPWEIFTISWTRVEPFPGEPWYIPNGLSCPTLILNERVFKWDLNVYSVAIKCTVEEVDDPTTTTIAEESVSKFATNFGWDAGEEKKFGFKFGYSSSQDITISYNRSFTQGNDELGETIINFADNVIVSSTSILGIPAYRTQEYPGGFYRISLEPIRVQ